MSLSPPRSDPIVASSAPASSAPPPASEERLLRIQEVAADVGLTARSIRYYEEIGLLKPAARSQGDYRLYDSDDIERLRFVKGLRDDAGFSLAEIGQLLEDESARVRIRARLQATRDVAERKQLLIDGIARVDRQVATLRRKVQRLETMIADAEARRAHLGEHLAETEEQASSMTRPGSPGDEA